MTPTPPPPRFVEVSHVIEPGMVTYPGLPTPEVSVIVDHDSSRERYRNKAEFLIASLHLCGNTGTYVDSPLHRYRDATDLAGLPLERVAHVPVRLFDARSHDRAVGPRLFEGVELQGAAVLVRTDFSRHWRTERYGRDNPFLTADACELLVRAGVAFVGIDSINIDDMADLARPAHTILLGAGIPVCEHMTNLGALPTEGGRLHAVPIAGGAAPPFQSARMCSSSADHAGMGPGSRSTFVSSRAGWPLDAEELQFWMIFLHCLYATEKGPRLGSDSQETDSGRGAIP